MSGRDLPGVVFPPPLIYLIGLLAGWGLQRLVPLWRLPSPGSRWAGLILVGVGIALAGTAEWLFARAGTPAFPYRASRALVVRGVYRLTRNPMYVAFTIVYLGVSLLIGPLWPLVLLPLVLWVMRRGVIDREERYLERKFGDDYVRYREAVPRWLW